MRNRFSIIFLAIILAAVSCRNTVQPGPEVLEGNKVCPFEVVTADGETMSDTNTKGHNTLILFFNTWCPDCHEWLPVIQQWQDEDTHETVILCIARGQNYDEIRPFWKENGYTMKVAPDPDKTIYDRFTGGNSHGVPLLYIIDTYGTVVKRLLQNEPLEKFIL